MAESERNQLKPLEVEAFVDEFVYSFHFASLRARVSDALESAGSLKASKGQFISG